MTDLLLTLARPSFDASFVEWLATASMEEIEGSYAESYKDANGIKARWVYDAGISREEFADMFVSLGYDLMDEEARQVEDARQFTEMLGELGLTLWCEANGVSDWYADAFYPMPVNTPEPFPYEMMAVRAGWGEPGRMVTV